MKRKGKGKPPIARPIDVPPGYFVGRLVADIQGLAKQATVYESAYQRLTLAIDALAKENPRWKLHERLRALVEPGK